ncbi:MAG: DUF1569 domain-containing protein [Phycisphaerae bacterium]
MSAPTTAQRRALRFNSINELIAEIDRIVAADAAGRIRRTGNWTAGQAMNHLGSWIEYGYEGFPFPPPPWFVRIILRFMKNKYLRQGMPSGVRIPGAAEGTYATEPMSAVDAAAKLKKALGRLQRGEAPRFDSPAFGKLTEDERIALQLRHAELHLSFLHPE